MKFYPCIPNKSGKLCRRIGPAMSREEAETLLKKKAASDYAICNAIPQPTNHASYKEMWALEDRRAEIKKRMKEIERAVARVAREINFYTPAQALPYHKMAAEYEALEKELGELS